MKIKKYVLILVMAFAIGLSLIDTKVLKASNDAYVSVSANTSEVYVGDTISFTVSTKGAGYITVSGAASDYDWYDNSSKTFTVSASSAGTITLSASGVLAGYELGEDTNVSDSVSVKVNARPTQNNGNSGGNSNNTSGGNANQTPSSNKNTENNTDNKEKENLSNNANLSSLSVSTGTLNPKFSASKTQYTVNLTGDISSIKISAKAADSKAFVSGTGEKSLKAGKNTIVVSVVAEDGTQKDYEIIVNVDESPLVYSSYNGVKLGFVRNLDDVDKPGESFEKTTLKIDGKEVSAWKSNLMKKAVVYLQNEETKEKNYYLFNTETNTVETKIQPMALLGNDIFVVDIPEKLQKKEGMKFTKVKIDKYELDGWKFNDSAFDNYALIYVMNEKGDMVYYQYESTENTLQLYSEAASVTQTEYDAYRNEMDNKVKTYTWIMYGLGAGCVVLFAGCIVLMLRKRNTIKYPKQRVSINGRDAETEILRNISDEE